MNQQLFDVQDLPVDDLHKIGLIQDDGLVLDREDIDALLSGGRTSMLRFENLNFDGFNIPAMDAKISLKPGADGELQLMLHPIYKKAEYPAWLSDTEAEKLEKGEAVNLEKMILITELQVKYPDFIGNIDKERVSNKMLTDQLAAVNDQYRTKIFMATNEEKIKAIQEDRNKAIKDEADARERVAKASGLSAEALAKLSDEEVKNMAIQVTKKKVAGNKLGRDMAGVGSAPGFVPDIQTNADEHDLDLILNGRKRIADSTKEENDLLAANGVYQKKLTDQEVANIDTQIAAIKKRMATESDEAKAQDTRELERLNRQRKQAMGIVDAPQSGPTKADQDAAAKKLQDYNKELQSVREQTDQLVAAASKGTVDDLDAQLKIIQDKYEKVIAKIKELLKDPHTTKAIRDQLTGSLNTLTRDEQQDKDNTSSAFKKAQDEKNKKEQDEELKGTESRVNDVYAQGKADLGNSETHDLNNITDVDPKAAEALRLNIQAQYAQKRYELEQQNLKDLKTIYTAYGKDTGKLDKQIADNSIKENERAAKIKEEQETAYRTAVKALQTQELNNISQGAELLESVLDKKSALYKAALLADKAVAVARVIIETNAAIAAFRASVAILGPIGIPMVAAYTIDARISEGLSIAEIAVATIQGLSGGSSQKMAKGGLIDGVSHDAGGVPLINGYTGQQIAEVEKDETVAVFSKAASQNNQLLIRELLYNSQYRNGAPVRVNTALATVPASSHYAKGGIIDTQPHSGQYSAGNAPAMPGFDIGALVDEMRLTRQAIKDQQVTLNYQYFKKELAKNVRLENNSKA